MKETDDEYLSIQDLLWRTMHGYVGILEQEKGHNDSEFIYDLKSACDDVAKASTIGDFSSAFIPLKKNTLSDSELVEIKKSYNQISEYLDKKEKGMATQKDFKEIIKILDFLMKNLNQARKSNKAI
jgi:hypothetical protein